MALAALNRYRSRPFSGAIFLVLATSSAGAMDVKPSPSNSYSSVRLLAGSRSGPVMVGGIAFQLAPKWKTYWRTPGDSGIAPHFDFTASENVDNVTVLWPAPKLFDDGAGGQAIGYERDVILPLRVSVKSADKPVILRAHIQYAICSTICVPVDAKAEVEFNSVASTDDSALRAALDEVPKPASIGDDNPLTIREVRRKGNAIIVDVAAPEADRPTLFVEPPTDEWSLPIPKLVNGATSGVRKFSFDLAAAPQDVKLIGTMLKYTLVAGDRGYEFQIAVPEATD